jgi:hypothetical protein
MNNGWKPIKNFDGNTLGTARTQKVIIGKGMNCGNVTQGAFTLGVRGSKVESPNIMLLPI